MTCNRPECRAEYVAGPDDIIKGIRWWSLCPGCRDDPMAGKATPRSETGIHTLMSTGNPHEQEDGEGDQAATEREEPPGVCETTGGLQFAKGD